MLVVLSSSVFDEKPRFQVALLEVTNGTLTYLKQFDRMPENVGLSHDGRYLAFTQNDDLYVANLLTGEARQIAGSSDVRLSLQWMPNDDALLFVTGRFASELRLIRLTDGLPVGMIEALRTYDGPFWLLGISATGDLYYSASGKGSTLSIASFDVAMQQLGAPAAVAGVQSGRGMDWSPDSESIAYASYNQTKTLVTISEPPDIG